MNPASEEVSECHGRARPDGRRARGHRRLSIAIVAALLAAGVDRAVPAETAASCRSEVAPQIAAQPLTLRWERVFGGPASDFGAELRITKDGGALVVGSTTSKGAGGYDAWMLRLDRDGKLLWERTMGGVGDEVIYGGGAMPDGGLTFVGYTASKGAGKKDLWVVRLDADGRVLWDRTYGGAEDDMAHGVTLVPDGGLIVVGHTESKGAGSADVWVLRLDVAGHVLWDRTFGGSQWEIGFDVTVLADGDLVVAGFTESFGAGGVDGLVLRYDHAGTLRWNKTFGGSETDQLFSVVAAPCGGLLVTGFTTSKEAGNADAWLIRLDESGNVLWEQTYGGAAIDRAWTAAALPDGGFLVNARTQSKRAGGENLWLLRVDAQGDVLWDQVFGGTKHDWGFRLYRTDDGEWLVLGETTSQGRGEHDLWLLRFRD